MPIKTQQATFMGWLEDFAKLPLSIPDQTIAVYKDNFKKNFVLLRVSARASSNVRNADLKLAYAQGSAEGLQDIEGVNTVVAATDFLANPAKAAKDLLTSTANDIINLEELKQLRAGTMMENLTKGITEDERGNNLRDPNNPVLKKLGIRYPIIDSAGKSLLQTSINVTPGKTATYRDRFSVETGETSTNPTIRTYANLGEAVADLAATGNSQNSRIESRDNALKEFNRSIARELNANLSETFSLVRPDKSRTKSKLEEKLVAVNGDIEALVSNPADLSYVLGMTEADLNALSPASQEFFRRFAKAEAIGLKLTADPTIHKKIISQINRKADVYGIRVIQNSSGEVDRIISTTGKSLTPETEKAWKSFLSSKQSAKKRVENFDALRTSYLKREPNGTSMYFALTTGNLGLEVNETRYRGITTKELYSSDLTFEHEKELVDAQIWFDIHEEQIKSDILKGIRKNPNLNKQAQTLYDKVKQDQLNLGVPIIDAENAAKAAQDDFWRTKGNETVNRVSTAVKNITLANDLFLAQTTEQLLESIADGKFIRTTFVASRLLGATTLGSHRFRSGEDQYSAFDPNTYATAALKQIGVIKEDERNIGQAAGRILGVAYEGSKAHKFLGIIPTGKIENRAWIQHENYTPGTNNHTGNWHTVGFKHNDLQGVYGDNSIFDELFNMQNNDLADPSEFLADPNKLMDFAESVEKMQSKDSSVDVSWKPQNEHETLAIQMGFNKGSNIDANKNFVANVRKALKKDATGNWTIPWLDKLTVNGKVPLGERWRLLLEIQKNGFAGVAKNAFIGPLNLYNRYANFFRDYLYKNLLWGNVGANIPILGKYVILPTRGILQNLGFSDEVGLSTVIRNKVESAFGGFFGNLRRQLLALGENPASPQAQLALSKVLGTKIASFFATTSGKFGGRIIFKVLGRLLNSIVGGLTGGISWALTLFGGTAWKVAKSLIRLDLRGAGRAIKEDISRLVFTFKKAVLYPVLSCCCVFPILLIFFILFGIFTLFVRYEEPQGGGVYGVIESSKISVQKTATQVDADTVEFTITVSKIAEEDVVIESFSDRLSYTPSCDIDSGRTINYGDAGFVGTLDTSPSDLIFAFQGKILTEANPSITETITLDGISLDDATYTNLVEVIAQNDGASKATASANHRVGEGGCATCPSAWPIETPVVVTQGPATGSSHSGAEAVDFAPTVRGQSRSIYATHNGVVRLSANHESCASSTTGYGCAVHLESPDGAYTTIYAHLESIAVTNGDYIEKGTFLGYMGSTGNSTGPHLHYEFPNVNYECVQGYPLRLRNIAGDQYVPETIKRGCVENCNQVIN